MTQRLEKVGQNMTHCTLLKGLTGLSHLKQLDDWLGLNVKRLPKLKGLPTEYCHAASCMDLAPALQEGGAVGALSISCLSNDTVFTSCPTVCR